MDEELKNLIKDIKKEQRAEEKKWPWYRRIPYQIVCYKIADMEFIPENFRIKLSNKASILFDPVWKRPKLKRIK